MKVLVTGASGFVGRRLVALLAARSNIEVLAASRASSGELAAGVRHLPIGDLAAGGIGPAMTGVDVVIHLAARVHVMRDASADPLAAFRRSNVHATAHLADDAAAAGVKRFVLVSSVKVNGEETPLDRPFRPDDPAQPRDAYGISKHEAELALRRIASATGMEFTIVRPVLVYGPGVAANFARMIRWLHRGIPLPFGSIRNLRSLVGIDNLCDLLATCATHPDAGGRVFLASDQEDVSTPELLRRIGIALGRPARLFGMPEAVLAFAFRALGQADAAQRLCSSLRVDDPSLGRTLGWRPPIPLDEGLRRASVAFLSQR